MRIIIVMIKMMIVVLFLKFRKAGLTTSWK